MKNLLNSITDFLWKYWYILLLLAAGCLSIRESIRITNKYEPSHWLSGPSGFIMIVGLALIALLLFEVISSTLRARRRAEKKQLEEQPVMAEGIEDVENKEDSARPQEKTAEEKLHNRNMWLSFGLLIVYTMFIKTIGFALSSALYLVLDLLLLKNGWKTTVITVIAILAFLLYGAPALSMSFPRGIFGF